VSSITNQGKSEQMLQALLEQVKESHYIYAYNTDTITTYNAEYFAIHNFITNTIKGLKMYQCLKLKSLKYRTITTTSYLFCKTSENNNTVTIYFVAIFISLTMLIQESETISILNQFHPPPKLKTNFCKNHFNVILDLPCVFFSQEFCTYCLSP
jgi:hypothetical protein